MQWTNRPLGLTLFENDEPRSADQDASVSIASLVATLTAAEASLVAAVAEGGSEAQQLKSGLALLQDGLAKAQQLLR